MQNSELIKEIEERIFASTTQGNMEDKTARLLMKCKAALAAVPNRQNDEKLKAVLLAISGRCTPEAQLIINQALSAPSSIESPKDSTIVKDNEADCKGWQPIELAPKHEDLIFWLVPNSKYKFDASQRGSHPWIGQYNWWEARYTPTHWQPLPQPPQDKE